MRIAVVNQHFAIGGVENFLALLMPAWRRLGHAVDLLLLQPQRVGPLAEALQAAGVGLRAFDRSDADYDVVMVTNPESLVRAARRIHRGGLQAERLVAGVYQTRMFCLMRGPLNLHNRVARELFAALPPTNAIFGNDACRTEHARVAPSMAGAPVVNLIVDGDRFRRRPRRVPGAAVRLVSIGRLEPFKTYNLTMPSVVSGLLERGHRVEWHVYGTGPSRPAMLERVAELGIRSNVHLHGDLEYMDMPAVLAEAFAFVGSGLAMMEAAACGVPTLPAIEYCRAPLTYGFVPEIAGNSFFEPGLPMPVHGIMDRLLALLALPDAAYETLGDACREAMRPFFADAVAEHYIRCFGTALAERPPLDALRYALYRGSALAHRWARDVGGLPGAIRSLSGG